MTSLLTHRLTLSCLILAFSLRVEVSAAPPESVSFRRDIQPLLSDRCFQCHGPDAKAREADLRLDVRDRVFGTDEHDPLIIPGKPLQSELYKRITSSDPDLHMPPKSVKRPLTKANVTLIRTWIEQGANWEEHWAFEPVDRPTLLAVKNANWANSAIDRFVLSRLESQNLGPSPQASKHQLIRRATLTLTGVPPTLSELDSFSNDDSPDAYNRLVDRLITSHRYGEHMSLPWLDASRYADTDGYQNDRTRYQWAWRDWLIRAVNDGMPFDQFTIEQLAGDMLPDATLFQQVASGFGRNHRINSEGGSIPAEWHVENVVDRVDTLGTIWLGLTVGCARCHDHKYDPLAQREYYRLFAYFNNIAEWGIGPNNGNSPPFITVPKNWPNLTPDQNKKLKPDAVKLRTTQVSVVRPQSGPANTVMVMEELPKPRPTYLLRRGLYSDPDKSEVLAAGLPSKLNRNNVIPANRIELARWLVSKENPLTARVIVNRYWQHFFGVGLVATSENFGTQGERPSHPELLDWLAFEFIRSGWNSKHLHRLIATSATFRQSSVLTKSMNARDPDNRLLARGPRFRLSAHAIRDQALAVSGLMVEKIGGPSVRPYMPPRIWRAMSNNTYKQDKGPSLYRRSVYTYWRRTIPPPTMANLNAAEREVCIVRKDKTNTPLQALTLLNNITFTEASRFLAERMLSEVSTSDVAEQIRHGFRIVLGRQPSRLEAGALREVFDESHDYYRQNLPDAKRLLSIGERPRNSEFDAASHAALTLVANSILNLDEAISIE
jgi:hypothetical protein